MRVFGRKKDQTLDYKRGKRGESTKEKWTKIIHSPAKTPKNKDPRVQLINTILSARISWVWSIPQRGHGQRVLCQQQGLKNLASDNWQSEDLDSYSSQ